MLSSPATSACPNSLKPRSVLSSVLARAIVAESLVAVPDPLVTALRPGPSASGADVVHALAYSLRPEEHGAAPPSWLLPHQMLGFRRVLAALERYGTAVLADPVGTGKTYVALAVAGALSRGPAACLVPAPLVAQWRTTAARLGVPVVIGSHQQASLGRLPASDHGLVIIDESHHFRHPGTKRYRHVAPWLVGRRALLLTATPVVNRLRDLAAQLLLAAPSDALARDGVASLRQLLAAGRASPALGRLVFESVSARERPRRVERVSLPGSDEREAMNELLQTTDRLRLSPCVSVAGLMRGALCGAAGSSPAALVGALRRYRALLLHARDAATAGCRVTRADIRQFTGERDDQLVWWELLAPAGASIELALEDLDELNAMIRAADDVAHAADRKLERLRMLLTDERPTLVFTARRETVRYLRDRLGGSAVAWCTGERAGIGHAAVSRDVVWAWFGRSGAADDLQWGAQRDPQHIRSGPRVLVTTDVAAEGLDLRRMARVVHYDLPFTPMRLDQREGRAVRLGSGHSTIEVVRFIPPPALEHRLGQMATLARKVGLPAAAGLGVAGRECWRWRAEFAERYGEGPRVAGVAKLPVGPAGVLAGYSVDGITSVVLWLAADGSWTEAPPVISARLEQAAASDTIYPVSQATLRSTLARLAEPIRARLALACGRRWTMPEPGVAARTLACRLQKHVLSAARRRDVAALHRLDRALQFLGSGHTAGEEMLIERIALLPEAELAGAAGRLPAPRTAALGIDVKLTGIVLFDPG